MTSTPREPFFQTESLSVPCDDYMAFKSALSELRKIDDRITFPLNRSDALTGDKADCGVIWRQLNNAWKQRDNAISACIGYAEQEVALIQAEKASGVADQDEIELEERRAKKSLSLMKSEVDIESIMRERSKEFFKRKCRAFMVANGIKF